MEQELRSLAQECGRELVRLGAKYKNLIVVTADTEVLSHASVFADEFPDRYVNCGAMGGGVIGVAAGMAARGFLPVVCVRVGELAGMMSQIKSMLCYPHLNVKILGFGGGVAENSDGALGQTIDDFGMMRLLPEMKVAVPAAADEMKQIFAGMLNDFGPTYVRLPSQDVPETLGENEFRFGKSLLLHKGKDIVLCAAGKMVERALMVAKRCEKQGVSVEVLNVSSIAPCDERQIAHVAVNTQMMVTLEDHSVDGGVGSMVMETLNQREIFRKVHRIGVQSGFSESGKADELFQKHGLDEEGIFEQTMMWWNELAMKDD